MDAPLALEGVPRELGFEQGRAARASIRRACTSAGPLARILEGLGHLDRSRARWLRDVRRHFPHQAEWLEGASRAAGVPLAALVRAAGAALASPEAAVVAVAGPGQTRLACRAAADAILRRVAPEGRFRSLELARALLPAPDLGVNEAGLAVAVRSGAQPDARCAAPAALLARDCLERFESVASALAWCLGRPAQPGAALLLADAAGEVAGVELAAGGRRVLRPEGGVLVLGADGADAAEISKRLAGRAGEARAIAQALGAGDVVCVDPARRELSRAEDRFALDPTPVRRDVC